MKLKDGYSKWVASGSTGNDNYLLTAGGGYIDKYVGIRNYCSDVTDEYQTNSWAQYYLILYSIDMSDFPEEILDGEIMTYFVYVDNTSGTLPVNIRWLKYNSDSDRTGGYGTLLAVGELGWLSINLTIDKSYKQLDLMLNHSETSTSTVRYKRVTLVKGPALKTYWTFNPKAFVDTRTNQVINGLKVITKDLGYNLADWVTGQHNGPFEVGRSGNTMRVAIGVTNDDYGYIQSKGYGITSVGNLVLNPAGGGLYYSNLLFPILHSSNYTTYTVKKDGTGATGDWGINITGSSKSIYVGTASGNVDYPMLFTTSTSGASNAILYMDADKKVTFNPSTNTLKASIFDGSLGDGTLNLYALYSNEINFGGSAETSTIHFGYRATDSKPIPIEFVFGRGLATLRSNGYIKNESSNNYVLLGGGSHKLISDFALSSSLPYSVYHFTAGCLVKTDIPTDSNSMVTFRIEGNSYGYDSILTTGHFYNYRDNDKILNYRALHHGANFGNIKAFCYDGYVHIWFKLLVDYQSYIVTVYCTNDTSTRTNRVTSIISADLPTTGVTRLVEMIPTISINSTNYTTYTVTKTGVGASGTWGINISGNANTANTAKYLSTKFSFGGGLNANKYYYVGNITLRSAWDGYHSVWNFTGKEGAWGGNLYIGFRLTNNTKGFSGVNLEWLSLTDLAFANSVYLTYTDTTETVDEVTKDIRICRIYIKIPENYKTATVNTISESGSLTLVGTTVAEYEGTLLVTSSGNKSITAIGALYIFDYNITTPTPIYIGYSGNALTSSTALYLAAYGTTSSGARCIKDISSAEAKIFIGLGNVQNTAFYKRSTSVNGAAWDMAGTNSSNAFTIYAPTTAGTSGQVLISSGGTPSWTNLSNITAGTATKLATARTLWGQSFNGTANISGSLSSVTDITMSGRLTVNTSIADHSTPMYLCIAINCAALPEGTTITNKNAPGIGFHISKLSWASLVFTGIFRFIDSSTTAYADVAANKFIKADSSDSYVLLGGGGHKLISDVVKGGYIGTTLVQSSSTALALTGITTADFSGDITLSLTNTDRFINLKYTNNGYDWRIGNLGSGSGDANYFVIQSDKTGTTYYDALKIGCTSLKTWLGGELNVNGLVEATSFKSTVASGTQPYACTSKTLNTNLNADLLDGKHESAFSYNMLGDNYDCNNLPHGTHSATYRFNVNPPNAFPNASYGNLLVIGSGWDTMTQIGAPYANDNLYFRRGTWYSDGSGSISNNAWRTILHDGNSSVSGGGSTWGSSITVNIGGTSKTLTIPTTFSGYYVNPVDLGTLFKHNKYFTDTTNAVWYIKVVFDTKYNNKSIKFTAHPSYNNKLGAVYFTIDSYTADRGITVKTSHYNGNNCTGYYYERISEYDTLWLLFNGDASAAVTLYSTYDVKSWEIATPSGITFVPLTYNDILTNYNIKATNLIKSGSSDSYVLLGGGGHMALSTLQSEYDSRYDSRYVNASGDTMTGQLTISSVDNSNGIAYGGAIQLREKGKVANTQTAWEYSPAISFHWGLRSIKRLGMDYLGHLKWDDSLIYHAGNLTKSTLGLGNVDNTADADKNVNSATKLKYQALLTTLEAIDNFLEASVLKVAIFKTTELNSIGMVSNDGMLLSIPWTSTTYGALVAIDDVTSGSIKVRGRADNSWGSWHSLLHDGNSSVSKSGETLSVKINGTTQSLTNTTYSAGTGLSLNGTTFNINAGNEFPVGDSNLTDGTLILTSYASNSGFDDTNAVGTVYKRKASCIYGYIKGKLDSVYQAKGSYLTSHQTIYNLTLLAGTFSATTFDPNGSAKTVNIPTHTSHLTNDSGFITNAALSNLSDTYFKYRENLTSNVDFNTYFNGSYVNTTGNGSGNTNNIHNYGYLLAFPGAVSSGSYYSGVQIAIASDSRFHFRVHWNYVWSDWARLITTNDIDKYLPLSGGTMTGAISMGSNALYFGASNNYFLQSGTDGITILGSIWQNGYFHANNYLKADKYIETSGYITAVGSLSAENGKFYTNSSGAYWSSDRRLKDNINSARNLNIDSLIKEFDWKDTGKHSWGFIALELLEVLPEAVNYNEDVDRYSVNYDVAHSAAIASLNTKIKLLELRIKELEDGKVSNE